MAKAGGKGSGAAEDLLALGVGNDASELARAIRVLAQRGVRTPAGRERWAPAQVSRLLAA
jgi:hypothetical protein